MEFELQLYDLAIQQPNHQAKALANFLFREIIEDAHAKYNISQDDMRSMCRDAVNRAALYLELQKSGLSDVFSIYSIPGLNWDDPQTNTPEAENIRKILKEINARINSHESSR